MIILMTGDIKVEVIKRAVRDLPDISVLALPKDEPHIITRLPDIEQPPIELTPRLEIEEPFYYRFDKRRGKRKNRR